MILTAIDLFCGAGALSKGLADAGFKVVAAVDSWSTALQSYRANFPDHSALLADVTKFDRTFAQKAGIALDKIDLVAGGPPCQGFSIQRIGDDRDERNDLVIAFAHAVVEIRPRMFLMENVPGLLGRRGQHTVRRFTRLLLDHGYDLRYSIIDAAGFGVPQTRRRVFFTGWLKDQVPEFHFPSPLLSTSAYKTVRKAIGDLPEPQRTSRRRRMTRFTAECGCQLETLSV